MAREAGAATCLEKSEKRGVQGAINAPSEKLFVRRWSPDPVVRLTKGLQVTRRAGNQCEYCRSDREGQEAGFPIDHITPSARASISLATGYHSRVPCSTPGPAGSGRAQTLPRWLLPDTDSRFVKDQTGPDLDEHSLLFPMTRHTAKNSGLLPSNLRVSSPKFQTIF
jgi:hypothetical protein